MMGKVYKLSQPKSVNEASGMWLSKLDRGLGEQEAEQLKAWLAEDEAHRQAFLAMAKTWDEMTALEALANLFPEADGPVARPKYRGAAVAAGIALVACAIGWLALSGDANSPVGNSAEVALNDSPALAYETAIGEQSTTTLADGSTLVLNTNSQVEVRFSAHHRVLELHRGEAHIEVAPDNRRPLSVLAGESIIQAVGTAFGVKLMRDNKAELIVTEGEVLVATAGRSQRREDSSALFTPVLPNNSRRVEQGEQLLLGEEAATIETVSPEDIRAKMSWREGSLVFRNELLEDALREVERYTTVRFVFSSPDLRSQQLTGRYRVGDIDAFLDALGASHNISYARTDDGQVLLRQL